MSHILATGGSGGFVTVWDLKSKKPSLTLNNNRKPVSAIEWDPNNSTKLLTSTPDDSTPVIFLWDLRNSNAPERVLQGHLSGVLSISWCQHDSDLLLSCGKDNKVIVWNPQTGERYGEFPEVTNWTFLTRFNPHNPDLTATASFDGKIIIHTLQNTNPSSSQTDAQSSLDGEDFFTSAQTQPQDTFFSLPRAPKWAERPVGATFGFGGKLVVFTKGPVSGNKRTSKLTITHFDVDTEVGAASEKFEEALKSGDISAICETRIEESASNDEKADWEVMEMLAGQDARQKIVQQLGFKQDESVNGTKLADPEEPSGSKDVNNSDEGAKSGLFGEDADEDGDGDDDFFSKGPQIQGDRPFHILGDEDSVVDKEITKAVMLGNFRKATDICLKEDRMADAFLIANCGGQELVDKVQTAYLAGKKASPSYVRLLGSVITKDLWDVVNNADLENWKEIMAVLCTFSSPDDFPSLCEALGDRIVNQGARKDASFCYLVGSKLEKVVPIWISALEEAEQARLSEMQGGSSFSVHAKTLQDFIEKVTVFRHVAKFQDKEIALTSGWKLAPLYDKYTEYADIVAAHGQLLTAQKYLDLLPTDYPAAELARDRVKLATKKAAAQPAVKQANKRTPSRAQPAFGYQPPQSAPTASPVVPSPMVPAAAPANPYAPQTNQPYAPATNQAYAPPTSTSPYTPASGYQPPASQAGYPGPSGYGPPSTTLGAPPRNITPSRPPPSQDKSMDNWNDVPLVAKKAPPRRATPSAPVTSPFPNQPGHVGPPPSQSPYGRTGMTPPPPPPKAGAPPRVTSPLAGPPQSMQQQGPPRPPSTAANAYAPPSPQPVAPPQSGGLPPPPQPTLARAPSPYSAPPSGPPPSNRYAPAPSPPVQPPANQPRTAMPPPNPYGGAAPTQQGPPRNPYAPASYGGTPEQSKPPIGPPPSSGPPAAARPPASQPPPPPVAAAPPKPRHPPGDRTHIPANAQRLVDILTRDAQRVASRAPANFAPQVKDTQKRLDLLFDHLNNEELVHPDTIEKLAELAEAIEAKDYDAATSIQVTLQTTKTEECGKWMVSSLRPQVVVAPKEGLKQAANLIN